MAPAAVRQIRPQPGPQLQFLSSAADIAVYGGAAGGGKTWALLIEPLRHIDNPGFGAVFFRRTTVQVRNEGGLWDESHKLYAEIGGVPRRSALAWRFPSGASVSFSPSGARQVRLWLAGGADSLDLFRRADPLQRTPVLVFGQPQPLHLRRAPLSAGDLQP
jgi:hypothetical protein